jgi:hypothetical protein
MCLLGISKLSLLLRSVDQILERFRCLGFFSVIHKLRAYVPGCIFIYVVRT